MPKQLEDAVVVADNVLQLALLVTEIGCIVYTVAGGVNVGRGHLQHLAQVVTGEKNPVPSLRMKRGFWMVLAGVLFCLCVGYVAHRRTMEAILYGTMGILCQDRASKARERLKRQLARQVGRRISPDANPNRKRSASKRRRYFP